MTRTSTDSRRVERGERQFRRALLAVVLVLATACTALAVVGATQGPKVSSVRVDTDAVTQRPAQQLRIFANQAIAQLGADQVTVEPEVPISVAVSGDVIAITFDRALRYATTYTVRIDGATSPYASTPSTMTTEFTTPAAEVWMLERGSPDDVIVRSSLPGKPSTQYTGQRIQSFAVFPGAIAIATINADLTSTVTITSLDGVQAETLPLPAGTSLRGMQLDPGGTILGFQLTSLTGDEVAPDTLYLVDLESGRSVLPVAGLDGAPMRVLEWRFEQSGGILALTSDGMLMRIGDDAIPIPLGRAYSFGPISADGSSVMISDGDGVHVLDLGNGTRAAFEIPGLGDRSPILDTANLLADGSVVLVAVSAEQSRVTSELVVAAGGEAREVFSTTGGSIAQFSVSPNGQYAAIALVPDVSAASSDLYGADAMATTIETVIVDLATGEEIARLPGFGLQW